MYRVTTKFSYKKIVRKKYAFFRFRYSIADEKNIHYSIISVGLCKEHQVHIL